MFLREKRGGGGGANAFVSEVWMGRGNPFSNSYMRWVVFVWSFVVPCRHSVVASVLLMSLFIIFVFNFTSMMVIYKVYFNDTLIIILDTLEMNEKM